VNGGAFSKVYSLQHTDPYRVSMACRERNPLLSRRDAVRLVLVSNFSSKTVSGGVTWDYPISEYQYLRVGGSIDSSQLLTNRRAARCKPSSGCSRTAIRTSALRTTNEQQRVRVLRNQLQNVRGLVGWGWDTRNRTLFADRGMRQTVSLSSTIPGSNVKYWVGKLQLLQYVPIYGPVAYSFSFTVDYGAPFGGTTALPPYRNYFGGGPDDVLASGRAGWVQDQFGNPYGGNMKVVNRNEIILPMPAKWRSTAR